MKSRCYCKNVSCLPFVVFWCQEEKFSSSFGRWTAFDDPRPVTDRRHNARRCMLGCDSTPAEKWSTAIMASVQVQQSWHPDWSTRALQLRCSMQAPASAAAVLNRAHVAQARNLSSMHAPMFGLRPHPNVWRLYLLYGRNRRTCLNRPEQFSKQFLS